MYTNIKSIQLLVSMMKKRGINTIVVSPGNSHNAIVRSLEEDTFFKTYCITDERSAAFFALGLIQQLQKPVAILCTSGTAASNYLSGVTEGFRREMPLVVITGDKVPYYLNQMEDQMIDQPSIFKPVTKHSISLPIIKDGVDEWYCTRILNEAFLEMNHHGTGPVHINVPIGQGMLGIGADFTTEVLPDVRVIERYDHHRDENEIATVFENATKKRILFICGQDISFDADEIKLFEAVSERFNCVLSVDALSNNNCKYSIKTSRTQYGLSTLVPDIVITLNGNSASQYKFNLKSETAPFEHWRVCEDGKVADPFRKLSKIFEFTTKEFLSLMLKYGIQNADHTYYKAWKNNEDHFRVPKFKYSNLYACCEVLKALPANSVLNLGNSTTIRIAQFFDFDPSIHVFCNRGVNGIDGSMSAFIGQSAATDKLSFLLIGDLSFFYDMNALWNRYVGKNVRIMLFNNEGAALFHFNQGIDQFPTLNENVAAEHFAKAEGWCVSQGFEYLSATSKQEFDDNLATFVSEKSEKPIVFEVFTHKETDAEYQHEFYESNRPLASKAKQEVKKAMSFFKGKDK